MARKFKELEEKMPAEARARVKARANKLLQEMALDELRAAREMTQTSLARILEVGQSEVSKIENRTDMYISTLASYVKAMGGDLEICAVFPDGKVKINQFEELGRAHTQGNG
jgi:DNA-binding XRE family transcriptional regulator